MNAYSMEPVCSEWALAELLQLFSTLHPGPRVHSGSIADQIADKRKPAKAGKVYHVGMELD